MTHGRPARSPWGVGALKPVSHASGIASSAPPWDARGEACVAGAQAACPNPAVLLSDGRCRSTDEGGPSAAKSAKHATRPHEWWPTPRVFLRGARPRPRTLPGRSRSYGKAGPLALVREVRARVASHVPSPSLAKARDLVAANLQRRRGAIEPARDSMPSEHA